MVSSGNSLPTFRREAIDKTLDLLNLIELPGAEQKLVEQWHATGEPVRFDGAVRLAERWIASPPPRALTDHLMPFVLFLLGWPQTTAEAGVARQVLVPYLRHHLPRSRWAAALSLGWLDDDRAIPLLIQMLTEYLPDDDAIDYTEDDGLAYDDCLDLWRGNELMKVILHRHAEAFARPLRAALDRVLGLERRWVARFGPLLESSETLRVWPILNSPGIWWWAQYQDALVFALGQVGAFDLVRTLECPRGLVGVQSWSYVRDPQDIDEGTLQRFPFRPLLWCVHAVLGHLFYELPLFPARLRGSPAQLKYYDGLDARVLALLDGAVHLSPEEQVAAMTYYEESLYLLETMFRSDESLSYMQTRAVA